MIPIKSSGDEPLESLLNRATNPLNPDEDWLSINGFCDRLNEEAEGPVLAVKLLAHKIQSPQEKEALYALTVLEMCVQRCGQRFHQEIGKFRFLNEIIKVISPKYLGQYTTDRVKLKCIAMLYSWTQGLPSETKIKEAYQMLKSQGIIKQDPTSQTTSKHLPQAPLPAPAPRPPGIFGNDEEKAKQLSRLLKSRNPADLAAANRMIKNMVKEDNDRVERLSKRMSELETVRNNTKLLSEMLQHYHNNGGAVEDTEIMRELFQTLETARPNLVRLARETDENDNDGITEILQVNDAALEVIKRFQECNIPIIERSDDGASSGTLTSAPDKATSGAGTHDDLLSLDNSSPPPYTPSASVSEDILSRDLAALGLHETPNANADQAGSMAVTMNNLPNHNAPSITTSNSVASRPDSALLSDIFSAIQSSKPSNSSGAVSRGPNGNASQAKPPVTRSNDSAASTVTASAFDDLSLLGKEWVEQQMKSETKHEIPDPVEQPLVDVTSSNLKYAPLSDPFGERLRVDLSSIDLPISEVRPSTKQLPRTLFEKPGGLKLQIHFTDNRPALNVRAFVAMIASTLPQPVSQIQLEIIPNSSDTRVNLKEPSSTELAPFSPFAPQMSVTQILLVESVNEMDPIVLRYQLNYTVAGSQYCEEGESDNLAEFGPVS